MRVQGLSKTLAQRAVVQALDLEVYSAEIVGLLGANGSGKTTTFRLICGLLAVDQGSVSLNGQDISHLPLDQRSQLGLGYLPQEPSIFRGLSVADNIRAVLELRGGSIDRRESRLQQLLSDFQLLHLARQRATSLSGGERRRLEIARLLVMEPYFLLLDEPFAGVDPIAMQDLQQLLRRLLARRIGILITDHNVREMLQLCHRSYILNDGRIVCHGSAEHILADEQSRRDYLGEQFSIYPPLSPASADREAFAADEQTGKC